MPAGNGARVNYEIYSMKSAFLLLLATSLLTACGRTEKKETQTSLPVTDSVAATVPAPKNCQSIVKAGKLGKPDLYQESAKPVAVSITMEQDTSSMQVADGCYFNNTVTLLATKKSGSRVFKRTLLKDDLLYFIKSDDAVNGAILQSATYKPTFNSQRYITFTMHLVEPASRKTLDYLVTMNYFGEIIKVK